jgi:hypothetical protein
MMHGKSDSPIVLAKLPNKAACAAAEAVEGRGLAKGNSLERKHVPDSEPALRRCGTMKALTPAPLTYGAGLPVYLATPSVVPSPTTWAAWTSLLPPRQRVQRFSDFALQSQARRSSPPNRVRLPTDRQFASGCSPRRLGANAVTFGYGVVAYSDTDFHRANVTPSRAHDSR